MQVDATENSHEDSADPKTGEQQLGICKQRANGRALLLDLGEARKRYMKHVMPDQ